MRVSMLLALLAAAASASAQTVEMVATKDGKPAGSGTFSISPGPNHSYTQSSKLKLSVNGENIELLETVRLAFDGTTLESDSRQYIGGKLAKSLSITFDTHGANVTDGLTKSVSHVASPSGAKLKDPAQLWFISIRPRVGNTSTTSTFEESSMMWQSTTRTYVNDVPYTYHGAKVTGHELKDEQNGQTIVSLLDDRGLPYEFEVEGFKFERK